MCDLELHERYARLLTNASKARMEWVAALEAEKKLYQSLCTDGKIDSATLATFNDIMKVGMVAAASAYSVQTFDDFKAAAAPTKPVSKATKKKRLQAQMYPFVSGVVNNEAHREGVAKTDAEWSRLLRDFVLDTAGDAVWDSLSPTPRQVANAMLRIKGISLYIGPTEDRKAGGRSIYVDVEKTKKELIKLSRFSEAAVEISQSSEIVDVD